MAGVQPTLARAREILTQELGGTFLVTDSEVYILKVKDLSCDGILQAISVLDSIPGHQTVAKEMAFLQNWLGLIRTYDCLKLDRMQCKTRKEATMSQERVDLLINLRLALKNLQLVSKVTSQ